MRNPARNPSINTLFLDRHLLTRSPITFDIIMAKYSLLKRLSCIMHIVKTYEGITKNEILDRLSLDYDLEVGDRTFERDLKNLRDDFGLTIAYSHVKRGYILEEDKAYVSKFVKFAEFSSLAEIYDQGLNDYSTFQKIVIPDDSSHLTGIYNMSRIIRGITLSRKLSFTKENYYHEERKEYIVSPLQLKEYQNRWYLIAVPEGYGELRNFGIDRISNLQLLDKPAEKLKDYTTQITQYDDIVGLNYNGSKEIERIVLKVSNKQIRYLRSLPLHKSQVCVDGTTSDWGKVTYELKPNHEFKIELLKMMKEIEVMEPKWFRAEIAGDIREMNNLYK